MKFIRILFLLVIVGCSSSSKMMIGQEAQLLTGDQIANLKMTAQIDKLISIEKYRLINIYLRNLNDSWLRVSNTEVLEVSSGESFNVILGKDLETWLKSIELDRKLKVKEAQAKKIKVPELRKYDTEDHLYTKFSVPSQLQTNKWVLLQLRNKKLDWIKIKIKFIDGSEQVYKVDIK